MPSSAKRRSPPATPPADAPARAAVNRANARRSTGPKTAAGKAVVARNSIGHGIYALSPVVEGLESAQDWEAYRQAMLDSLEPQGMLEETLAERIILAAWRLRRTARYETERILLPIEEQKNANSVGEESRQWQREFIKQFVAAADEDSLAQADAGWLLEHAWDSCAEGGDESEGFTAGAADRSSLDDYLELLSRLEPCTVGKVRKLLGRLAGQHETTAAEVIDMVCQQIEREQEAARRTFAGFCSAHLLPATETLEKVMRYETHLSRQFHRDLHELERLRAGRQGQLVAAPLAMDIDVVGIPNLPPPQ